MMHKATFVCALSMVLGVTGAALAQTPAPNPALPPIAPPVENPAKQEAPEPNATEGSPTEQERFSFGTFPFSLLFMPDQVTALQTVLKAVESQKTSPTTTAAGTATSEELAPFLANPNVINEPSIYPVFYLSSVVYHDANDWVVWLANKRITPKNNNGELQVTSVTSQGVTFRWKPSYIGTLVRRKNEDKLTDATPVQNRLTVADSVTLNTVENAVSFSLKPNQSFSAAHLKTFEGKVNASAPPALVANIPTIGEGGETKTSEMTPAEMQVVNDMAGGAAAVPAANAPASAGQPLPSLQKTLETPQPKTIP